MQKNQFAKRSIFLRRIPKQQQIAAKFTADY
jgi:hypothetical protein